MTLLAFKQHFNKTLITYYPQTEVDSFFKMLLEDVLQLSKIDFALNPNQKLAENQVNILHKIVDGLKRYEPIQYLIGWVTFMDLKFNVNQNVLIPRPETETLIDWIVQDTKHQENINILDIGTGTGCIPIALAKKTNKSIVSSIDVSTKAITVAKTNATLNNVEIQFIHQNILTTEKLNDCYNIIVSNPPYVRDQEKLKMHKNVLDYEPHLALFVADNNPLLFYKKIAELALQSLKPKGALYFEINEYLGPQTVDALKQIGFNHIELRKDLFGKDRMVKATL